LPGANRQKRRIVERFGGRKIVLASAILPHLFSNRQKRRTVERLLAEKLFLLPQFCHIYFLIAKNAA